ncbi:MAG: sigma-70 family RNA polymerase sigma factor [Bacteroidetes bacterium]|nr:sigma-70 family RNA polymerase sigma factor [Bacteroidota bacterium]
MSGTDSGEEANLIDRLRNGEQEALVELYKSNFAMVKSYVLRNNGALEDAEDLLQESLVVLWQNVRKAEFELTSRISTYLMAVCKNLWLKQLSKNGRMMGEELIQPQAHSVNPDHGQNMDLKKIGDALDEMGETCRTLLVMFYFDGYDMDTIAKTLNFNNADTAKAKKYQCFKKLEEIVKKRYRMSDFLR